MSFDIDGIHLEDDSPEALAVQWVMSSEHVGASEAVRSILRRSVSGFSLKGDDVKSRQTLPQNVSPLTEQELANFNERFPSLSLFKGLSDGQWDELEASISTMQSEGFPERA